MLPRLLAAELEKAEYRDSNEADCVSGQTIQLILKSQSYITFCYGVSEDHARGLRKAVGGE